MRERLIELIKNAHRVAIWHNYNINEYIADALIAEGVIVPPVKVGATLYHINRQDEIEEYIITDVYIRQFDCGFEFKVDAYLKLSEEGWARLYETFTSYEFGYTVFLTREEAEQALAERNKR